MRLLMLLSLLVMVGIASTGCNKPIREARSAAIHGR